ncbi:hypothetical protein [Ferribacterium limneticum]|uniref:hypothetical protein n=1 Tax=Ferribacterium limneticum TaxID=76259 RepID=UPI001CFBADC3|nr:hypothetical protein [Ferribacterium limneticum]UCV20359.1 hypothetical protein KI610_07250 [Ferribacterium limneticum]
MAIKEHKCPQNNMTIYRNPRPERKAMVVTVACSPSLETDQTASRYYAYLEYPLTFIVQGDTVTEVDLSAQGFMYESGKISFITDLDQSDMPEFWLFGDVCECDGEPEDFGPNGCDCDGGVVVEFRNGSLHPWKNRKRVKAR